MKKLIFVFAFLPVMACHYNKEGNTMDNPIASAGSTAVTTPASRHLFIDVHDLQPGKVKFEDVMAAHKKDLAVERKYHVRFIKSFVDEKAGKVYCLSEAPNAHSIYETHKEAHGLLPAHILKVADGKKAKLKGGQLFLDIHRLQPGSVTPEAVAEAHQKDLIVESKYGVNFINYW
jgi:hypothetical protein